MTKKQLKEAYTNWNREITKLGERKEKFQRVAGNVRRERRRNRWCCIEKLVEELTKKGYVYTAMNLISEYYNICGQEEALLNLALATNNFEI